MVKFYEEQKGMKMAKDNLNKMADSIYALKENNELAIRENNSKQFYEDRRQFYGKVLED